MYELLITVMIYLNCKVKKLSLNEVRFMEKIIFLAVISAILPFLRIYIGQ
jgi:hypothetical protein